MELQRDDSLKDLINWDAIMPMPREAGGHDAQMMALFKGATVVAHYNEGEYQGEVATCVRLADGRYCIYNDYYGSCCGCDAWDGASDDDVRSMCIGLANNAGVFNSLDAVRVYLATSDNPNYSWSRGYAVGLLEEISKAAGS